MNKEIEALKKKRDAGKLTAFKYRQGVKKIKERYGKATPSTVSKVMTYISTKSPADAIRDFKLLEISPRSAKAVADKKKKVQLKTKKNKLGPAAIKKKAAEQTARSDSQLIKKAKTAEANKTFRDAPKKAPPKKRAAPKFNPSGLKVPAKKKAAPKKEQLYRTINPKTGEVINKKVSAKQHLKNIDMNKARIRREELEKIRRNIKIAAKSSMKKKKRG